MAEGKGNSREMRENPIGPALSTAIYILAGTMVLLFVLGSIVQGTGVGELVWHTDSDVAVSTGKFVQINPDQDVRRVTNVRDSTGRAVKLSGSSDSYWRADSNVNLTGDSSDWTIQIWASVDGDSGSENMTAVSYDGRIAIQYNGSQGNWSGWVYNESSTNSYRVNVSAADQPGNLTLITLIYDSGNLTIYKNATPGETEDATQPSVTPAWNTSNWDGRNEEFRAFDTGLNSSQRNATYNSPVHPLPNATRTARVYFDRGVGSSSFMYFAGSSVTYSNSTWNGSGLAGHQLSLVSDYILSTDEDGFRLLESSSIAGAPAVWMDYRAQKAPLIFPVFNTLLSGVTLMPIVAIILFTVYILAKVSGGNDTKRRR